MVNELRQLMREVTSSPPPDLVDLDTVVKRGRGRLRRRRAAAMGGTALATVLVVTGASLGWQALHRAPDLAAAGVPSPEGPVLRLSDAQPAVAGRDYRVLASHTNADLDADNGQYFDGVTADGKVLFRDGPRMDSLRARYALLDPASGAKDWLPDPGTGQDQLVPVGLGRDRLVLLTPGQIDGSGDLVGHVFDRAAGRWSTLTWSGLPAKATAFGATIGPDGRLYVPVAATRGAVPEGGWPVQPDGDAEDAGAQGDTFDLWSVSLSDVSDVRDEHLRLGSFGFSGEDLVWSDGTNGAPGKVHVRALDGGPVTTFDPQVGDRCNLLSFGVAERRVVMSEYCGTYAKGVRDDRVQVLSLDGDVVTTVQGSGIEGSLGSTGGAGVAVVTSYERGGAGTYLYDLADDRFLRVSDSVSQYSMGGPAGPDQFMWSVRYGQHGSTQRVGLVLH